MVRRLTLLDARTERADGDALKVAFASDDMHCVNQHFGSAAGFVVYDIDAGGAHVAAVIQFPGNAERDGGEGKLAPRLAAVEGCDAVYAEAIGPSAKAQLAARNVQALCVPAATPIADILPALRDQTRAGLAATWRRRRDPDRFEAIEAEGWNE